MIKYIFSDGTVIYSNLSAKELLVEELNHGKLVYKVKVSG